MEQYTELISDFKENNIKRKTMTLRDLKHRFQNIDNEDETKLIYEVFVKLLGPINIALTIIEPGSVNGEYYMTSGHIHEKGNPELYFLLEGEGCLLIEKHDEFKVLPMTIGEVTLMPAGYAHRTINTGKDPLKFITVHLNDSGRAYGYDFQKRLQS